MERVPEGILEKVVNLMGSASLSEDELRNEAFALLGDQMLARRVLNFVPEAFGAMLIGHIPGMITRLPRTFSVCAADGKWHELPFPEEPVFAQAVQLAKRLAHQGDGEVFETVSKRSSLFSLVNKSLGAGKEPEDIGMPALAFVGIPAEIYLPVP